MGTLKEINPKMIPECNIGTLGHVSHGKTSLVASLTGKITLTHSEELKRGITIRLGYADATIYRCVKCIRYSTSNKCPYCFSDAEITRTISFVDAPGHETLMATVLTGASLMDGVLFVIAANEKCPQLQTREHLAVLEIAGIKNAIIIQNKIDLVSEEQALKNYNEIKEFIKGTLLENAPIIPVSAQYRTNIDVVLEAMEEFIPTPKHDESKESKMLVARSFDINKPGAKPEKLVGGILGGAIICNKFSVGEKIEIRPGVKIGSKYQPLFAKIVGLQRAGINLDAAGTGGLLGMMTSLDPSLTKSDSLVGNVVGLPGKLPESKETISMNVKFMNRIEGMPSVKVDETILINVGTARSVGAVANYKKETMEMKLKIPVCVEEKEKVAISRQIDGRWRLVGYGVII